MKAKVRRDRKMGEGNCRVDERDHVDEPMWLHDAAVGLLNQPAQCLVPDALDLHE
jgi:hypothetical protein